MPKIKLSFSDFKPSVLQHWAVWLIITKFIKQKWTLQECFKKKWTLGKIQYGHHNPTKKHSETSLMAKVPSKINNFEGLEKVCHTFSQTFLWKRHDMPIQTSTENDPQNIVTHRIWQSTIRHTHRHSPYLTKPQKVKIPTLNLPSFQNIFLTSTFFQIWRYSFWRFFSVGDSDCRRFDRTFREIRLTSRPEIRSGFRKWRSTDGPDDSDDLRRYLITF